MAKCKNCEEPIEWQRDEDEERWIPLDPDTGERHDCKYNSSSDEEREEEQSYATSITSIPRCKYCNQQISFKQIVVSEEEGEDQDPKWVPYSIDGKQPHHCAKRKEAWIAEMSQKKGRSEAAMCKNGCGTLVFWNYDKRSKLNKMPLPFEQATNAYHNCPKYNPTRQRR